MPGEGREGEGDVVIKKFQRWTVLNLTAGEFSSTGNEMQAAHNINDPWKDAAGAPLVEGLLRVPKALCWIPSTP